MDPTIRDKVLYCSELFEQVPAEESEIQDAYKRFQAWYTNYTAGRAGTPSLDECLRDAPDTRGTILGILNDLGEALGYGKDSKQSPDANNSSKQNEALDSLVDKESMQEVINELENMSIFIRMPASVDRYEKAKYVNVDHFIPIDESHIEELFPKADPVLRNKLLRGVLSRRRVLRYAQEHKEELAKEAPSPQDEEGDENRIFGCADDETASDIPNSSSDMSIRVPPMPPTGQRGKPFQCPCCFSMIVARNREEWNLSSWYFHERSFHQMWICIQGCSKQFDSGTDFEAHLRVAHKELKDIAQVEEHGAQLPDMETETSMWCPMCHDETQDPVQLMKHMGRHQVQLGLWPLLSMRCFDGEDGAEMSDEKDKVPDNPAPSQDAAGSDSPPPGSTETCLSLDRKDYTVAWICASPDGLATAEACLDAQHKPVPRIPRGGHLFSFGEINGHYIVIGCSDISKNPQTSVANLAAMIRENFPGVKLCLSVSIAGAVPAEGQNIRLGDVAAGAPGVLGLGMDEVLQPARPEYMAPMLLCRAAYELSANYEIDPALRHDMDSILSTKSPRWRGYYSRPDHNDGPAVHRGFIASGTTMLMSVDGRKALADREDVICFDMEAAKLMEVSELAEGFPVMLIRGICDLCDTHDNEQWQPYAAMSAAVYARALLRHISPHEMKQISKHPSYWDA
ncbi:putative vps9-ankyrin repeat-containing protein [Metarhizium anisopliae]|nr:putative vps9-ankyrin repeat-containing protein [Metarhizium anisopliae]